MAGMQAQPIAAESMDALFGHHLERSAAIRGPGPRLTDAVE